jgi:hypothetical protein
MSKPSASTGRMAVGCTAPGHIKSPASSRRGLPGLPTCTRTQRGRTETAPIQQARRLKTEPRSWFHRGGKGGVLPRSVPRRGCDHSAKVISKPPHQRGRLAVSPVGSWNREPSDDSDDQGKGSDHDDRPQRDPDCEWHAPISLHVRSDQTQGAYWGTRQALHETISQRSPRFSNTADSNVGALMASPPALGFPDATAMPVAHAVAPLM